MFGPRQRIQRPRSGNKVHRVLRVECQPFQESTFEFDGHGRLKKSHKPENRDSSNNLTYTTVEYNPDDTVKKVIDPRGAETVYTYGNEDDANSSEYRALLTKIRYTSPDTTNIPVPADVTFTYDAAGNRKYMSDESGNLTYTFDELSRIKSETKNFADSLSGAPSGGYVLAYTYHLSGSVKSIVGPFGHQIHYSSDKVGRISTVGSQTDPDAYASGITYRAFGKMKSMSLSATDPIEISLTYDNALRPSTYEAQSGANAAEIHKASYSYYNDGALQTLDNQADAKFDHVNKYDFAGRLKENLVGTVGVAVPFGQTLSYDRFNNLTNRVNTTYGLAPVSFSATYSNNRKATGGTNDDYDTAGNVTQVYQSSPSRTTIWKYDASGRQKRWEELGPLGQFTRKGGETTFDGDGRLVKRVDLTQTYSGGGWGSWTEAATDRYIYSSVTGQRVTSLQSSGAYYRTHVYAGDMHIADERNGEIWFNLTDPLTGSTRETHETGALPQGDEEETRNELAGLQTSIPHTVPASQPPPNYPKGGNPGDAENGCIIDNFHESSEKCNDIIGRQLAKSVKDPDRIRGYWRDYDDPNRPGGVATTFIPFMDERLPGWQRLDEANVKTLANSLGALMENPLCRDFINGVIKNLQDKIVNGLVVKRLDDSIASRFSKIAEGGGFATADIQVTAQYVNDKITFAADRFKPSGKATIRFGIDNKNLYVLGPRITASRARDIIEISEGLKTTLTLVHELIHSYYGKESAVSHEAMAIASKEALTGLGITGLMPAVSRNGGSDFFDAALLRACGKVKL